jgi:hypothetical protein
VRLSESEIFCTKESRRRKKRERKSLLQAKCFIDSFISLDYDVWRARCGVLILLIYSAKLFSDF